MVPKPGCGLCIFPQLAMCKKKDGYMPVGLPWGSSELLVALQVELVKRGFVVFFLTFSKRTITVSWLSVELADNFL